MKKERDEISRLVERLEGDPEGASKELLPLVYEDLRRIAHRFLSAERPDHTLEPTALVHEAFVRLVGKDSVGAKSRSHFLAVAARCMRRILVDHARARQADKRGADRRVSLHDAPGAQPLDGVELLALHEAMERLATESERQARVVELRFFAGMSVEDVALALQVSERTVKGDWLFARAWLSRELSADER